MLNNMFHNLCIVWNQYINFGEFSNFNTQPGTALFKLMGITRLVPDPEPGLPSSSLAVFLVTDQVGYMKLFIDLKGQMRR